MGTDMLSWQFVVFIYLVESEQRVLLLLRNRNDTSLW